MNDIHEPSLEFTRHLEWQTRTELRRAQRFQASAEGPSSAGALARGMRIAALMLVSLLAGAGGVVAAERIEESRALEILLERNRVLTALAERRVESARASLEQREVMVKAGRAPSTASMEAKLRLGEALRERDLLAIDRVELTEAGRAVDLRISAPLVGPRDLVSERMRVERGHLGEIAEVRGTLAEIAESGYRAGIVPSTAMEEAKHAVALVTAEIARIDDRLALRSDHVLGRVEGAEAEQRDLIAEAESRGEVLRLRVERLSAALELVRRRVAVGDAPTTEEDRIADELDTVQVELELNALELELLR